MTTPELIKDYSMSNCRHKVFYLWLLCKKKERNKESITIQNRLITQVLCTVLCTTDSDNWSFSYKKDIAIFICV